MSDERHHFYKPKRASVISLTGFKHTPSSDEAASTEIPESKNPIVAAVESASSSVVVAICEMTSDGDTVLHRQEFDSKTLSPSQALVQCTQFLTKYKPSKGYHALGLLSSSPIDAWNHVDLLTPLQEACQGSLPLKIKAETTSAIGLAQDALAGDKLVLMGEGSNVDKKSVALGALVGVVGTAICFIMASKKK